MRSEREQTMHMQTVGTAVVALIVSLSSAAADVESVAEAIRAEAVRPNFGPEGRPLPLASSWTVGAYQSDKCAGWRPENQMRLIEQGHYLLPWFHHPAIKGEVPTDSDDFWLKYYKGPIQRAHELKLPLTFIASQWERGLSGKSGPYFGLPPEQNSNVVTTDGKVLPKVSPFGPVEPWRRIGAAHTDNPWMKQIQQWYPDPPLVIFLSNNEHGKLKWTEVEKSRRYMGKYGKGRDDDFKRKVIADGWIERYRALQDGMRQGLANDTWKKNAIFVGYAVTELAHFGRWSGWTHYSQHSKGRIDPGALTWDGGSPSYYTHDWNPSTDYKTWSPQIEFMNLVFVLEESYRLNPRYFFEFSTWDGYRAKLRRDKRHPSVRSVYRLAGQTYDPQRYGGFVQFGMWLMRPRAVRDFRDWIEPWDDQMGEDGRVTHEGGGPYFMALARAVDRVHNNPVLRQWWRKGELVPNRAHGHPYQSAIPDEWQDVDRWFLLDCSANAQEVPWEYDWPVNVFSLALTQGEKPNRLWLIYAHSPRGDRKDVKVTIPDYRQITITSTVGGSFYVVDEANGAVRPVEAE